MLDVSGLYVRYGLSEILKDVSLSVARGDIVTLLGRNGMGKTTTLRTIMGLTSCYRGSIHFEGKPIQDSPSWRVAQLGVGYVPEGRQIFPNLTVRENLVATARTGNGRTWDERDIYDLFPRLGERTLNMGNQLSGGEQQMLAIGRTLLTNPRLLILDEATEGLAPILRQEIWQCLEKLKELGQSIIIVDKNIKDLVKIANRHFVFERGRVVWSGDSPQLLSQRELIKTHLAV
jgi:branched-chain amino acid transport system ATP-binding protein